MWTEDKELITNAEEVFAYSQEEVKLEVASLCEKLSNLCVGGAVAHTPSRVLTIPEKNFLEVYSYFRRFGSKTVNYDEFLVEPTDTNFAVFFKQWGAQLELVSCKFKSVFDRPDNPKNPLFRVTFKDDTVILGEVLSYKKQYAGKLGLTEPHTLAELYEALCGLEEMCGVVIRSPDGRELLSFDGSAHHIKDPFEIYRELLAYDKYTGSFIESVGPFVKDGGAICDKVFAHCFGEFALGNKVLLGELQRALPDTTFTVANSYDAAKQEFSPVKFGEYALNFVEKQNISSEGRDFYNFELGLLGEFFTEVPPTKEINFFDINFPEFRELVDIYGCQAVFYSKLEEEIKEFSLLIDSHVTEIGGLLLNTRVSEETILKFSAWGQDPFTSKNGLGCAFDYQPHTACFVNDSQLTLHKCAAAVINSNFTNLNYDETLTLFAHNACASYGSAPYVLSERDGSFSEFCSEALLKSLPKPKIHSEMIMRFDSSIFYDQAMLDSITDFHHAKTNIAVAAKNVYDEINKKFVASRDFYSQCAEDAYRVYLVARADSDRAGTVFGRFKECRVAAQKKIETFDKEASYILAKEQFDTAAFKVESTFDSKACALENALGEMWLARMEVKKIIYEMSAWAASIESKTAGYGVVDIRRGYWGVIADEFLAKKEALVLAKSEFITAKNDRLAFINNFSGTEGADSLHEEVVWGMPCSADNELTDNELTDNELTDNELTDNELTDNELTAVELTAVELTAIELIEVASIDIELAGVELTRVASMENKLSAAWCNLVQTYALSHLQAMQPNSPISLADLGAAEGAERVKFDEIVAASAEFWLPEVSYQGALPCSTEHVVLGKTGASEMRYAGLDPIEAGHVEIVESVLGGRSNCNESSEFVFIGEARPFSVGFAVFGMETAPTFQESAGGIPFSLIVYSLIWSAAAVVVSAAALLYAKELLHLYWSAPVSPVEHNYQATNVPLAWPDVVADDFFWLLVASDTWFAVLCKSAAFGVLVPFIFVYWDIRWKTIAVKRRRKFGK